MNNIERYRSLIDISLRTGTMWRTLNRCLVDLELYEAAHLQRIGFDVVGMDADDHFVSNGVHTIRVDEDITIEGVRHERSA